MVEHRVYIAGVIGPNPIPSTMKNLKNILIVSIVGLAVAAGVFFLVSRSNQPGNLDGFAACLKEKGAMFYGAFWCPHCQNQKAMFGKSQKLLPYTECSTPDGNRQLDICKDKKIEGYPTWEFQDGSREMGEVPLETLSQKTGCHLPSMK
jgi:thiol-disulfide isomerase/thioredoxin